MDEDYELDYGTDEDLPEEADLPAQDEEANADIEVEGNGEEGEEGDEEEEEEEEEEAELEPGASSYDAYDVDILRAEEGPQTDVSVYTGLLDKKAPAQYRTAPYLTQYERARVLGMRSQQLSMGAEPMVGPEVFPGGRYPLDDFQIAVKELQMRRMPFIIGRKLPNGAEIKVAVSDLLVLE